MAVDDQYYESNNSTYNGLKKNGTGEYAPPNQNKVIDYPFGKYIISVELTPSNKFVGIVEVKINKDFLSYKQKITPKGYHDVDEFYKE